MAAVAVAEKLADVAPPKPRRLARMALKEEVFVRTRWFAKAGAGDTADDIRCVGYFGHCANRLRRHDIITVLLDDETQELELCVEKVLRDEVHTSVRKVYQRQGVSNVSIVVDDRGEFRCEWLAGRMYCIIRNKDEHAVLEGYNDAVTAISEWRKQQPRPVVQ